MEGWHGYHRGMRRLPRPVTRLAVVAGTAWCLGCGSGSPAPVDVQILAITDFHGALEPGEGSNGRIESHEVGGLAYLATHLARLRATSPHTIVVAAGDNIGASPLLSSMFHDEPTIEGLGEAGLEISAVGNHEFDEGWWELLRMQRGGCHPTDGCQDGTPYDGARFEYLAANVLVDPAAVDPDALRRSGWTPGPDGARTLFPASVVRTVGGVKVGFIGLVTRDLPALTMAQSIRGLTIRPEAEAANEAVATLVAGGVHAIVVLVHSGASADGNAYDGCEGVSGPVMDITRALSAEVDVVVAGHSHGAYNCVVNGTLVTAASSYGRLITDVDLRIDPRTGDVVEKTARNELVTRDVPPSDASARLLAHYLPLADARGRQSVGTLAKPLTLDADESGEVPLGDVVADAILAAGRDAPGEPAVAALTNRGGLRAPLVGNDPTAAGEPRTVTYAQVFAVAPFGNRIQVRTVTGDVLLRWLEQQFDSPAPGADRMLQISGLTYAYRRSRPPGERVDRASVRIGGRRLDAAARYRIASNDFVWGGGDAYSAARESTDPVDVGADIDVLIAHLEATPGLRLSSGRRIVRLPD